MVWLASGSIAQDLPSQIYVLLYNSGGNNEGIHTIQTEQTQTILMFESFIAATDFGAKLAAQKFPEPKVEAIATEEVTSFCQHAEYVCRFVPQAETIEPPPANIDLENTPFFNHPPQRNKAAQISFFMIRSHIYFDKQKYSLALADLDRVIEIDPQRVEAYIRRGAVYSEQERSGLAIANCQRAIELEPQNPQAYELLGFIHLQQSEYAAAKKYFIQAQQYYRARDDPQAAEDVREWLDRTIFYQRLE